LASANNSTTPSRRWWLWILLALILAVVLYSYLRTTPLKVHAVTV
jgi:hypothetical protein